MTGEKSPDIGDVSPAEQHARVDTLSHVLAERDAEIAELRRRLARQESEIENIYASSTKGMALLDADRRYLRVNPVLAQISGLSEAAHIGQDAITVVPGIAPLIEPAFDEVIRTGNILADREVTGRAPHDVTERLFDVGWYPVMEDGAVVAVGIRAEDVTERRANETLVRHMVRELQHRVKNTLANVLALVEQARRSSATPEEALAALQKRIVALAMTHGRLTEANWQATGLRAMFEQELLAVHGEQRVTLSGDDVQIGAQSALALSMAVHELATNSARFGALAQDGHIAVDWRVEDEWLAIRWHESGDAAPTPIERPGFGWRLIDASIRTALRGSIETVPTDSGFDFHIRLPMGLVGVRPPQT